MMHGAETVLTSALPAGNRYALIIACAKYEDPALNRLRSPARDAAQLAEVLADPAIGGFTVTTLIDERVHNLRVGIQDFLDDRDPDDFVLVYLSCHGLTDQRRRLHFAAIDTTKSRLAATGIESQWLLAQLDDCYARRQVVVLDCCFSGSFARGTKGDDDLHLEDRFQADGQGRAVLTASRSTEYSFEGEPVGETASGSVFTTALVDGLRTGNADADRDGYDAVDEAFQYAYARVTEGRSRQTPQLWLYGNEGRMLLGRSPIGVVVEPAPIPDAIQMGLDSRVPEIRIGALHALHPWLASADTTQTVAARRIFQQVADTDTPRVAAVARHLQTTDGTSPAADLNGPTIAAEEARLIVELASAQAAEEEDRAERARARTAEAEARAEQAALQALATEEADAQRHHEAEQALRALTDELEQRRQELVGAHALVEAANQQADAAAERTRLAEALERAATKKMNEAETLLRQAQREAVDVMVKAKELADRTLAEAGMTTPDGFPEAPRFETVLRGYDRQQVDDWAKAIRTADRGKPVTAPAFPIVLRGYEKADVDRWVDRVRHWAGTTGPTPKTGR